MVAEGLKAHNWPFHVSVCFPFTKFVSITTTSGGGTIGRKRTGVAVIVGSRVMERGQEQWRFGETKVMNANNGTDCGGLSGGRKTGHSAIGGGEIRQRR